MRLTFTDESIVRHSNAAIDEKVVCLQDFINSRKDAVDDNKNSDQCHGGADYTDDVEK